MCMITESSELCDIICNQSIMWGTWMPGKRDIVRDEEVGKVLLKSQSILERMFYTVWVLSLYHETQCLHLS